MNYFGIAKLQPIENAKSPAKPCRFGKCIVNTGFSGAVFQEIS